MILNQKLRFDRPFEGQIGIERPDQRAVVRRRVLKITPDLIASCAYIHWPRERFDTLKLPEIA